MRTDIPLKNSRGAKTVMGFVMDAADEVTRGMPFTNEQAKHEWIETHFNELLRRGSQNFCRAGLSRINLIQPNITQ